MYTHRLISCPNQFFKRINQNSWNARMISSTTVNTANFLVLLSHYGAAMIEIHLSKQLLVSSSSTKQLFSGAYMTRNHLFFVCSRREPAVFAVHWAPQNTRMTGWWLVLFFLRWSNPLVGGGIAIFVVCRFLIFINRARNISIICLCKNYDSVLWVCYKHVKKNVL